MNSHFSWKFAAAMCVALGGLQTAMGQSPQRMPCKVEPRLPDVLALPDPSSVRLEGYLGQRVANNVTGRLLVVNEDELLDGFCHRPGKQDWIGEHVGKFLHAATLAWANTGDAQLRAKIDRVAAELIKTQDVDGYLGTYTPDKHWTSWDVWVHKYDLIGLLTYYQYTGYAPALEAARKVGDLLVNTFGPGKRSIIAAGTHVGMAATSVLEPVVLLYRMTGEPKYLDFARYIVESWNEPKGPRIIQSLTELKSVSRTANGKAYEMMSNLVGLCELARATGDKGLLTPVINAWEDVVVDQLYITGSASHGEHFGKDFDLPNVVGANICETCVTVTWIQLNAQLLRLTGQARFGEELERSYYNHLMGAQRPDGVAWCYYTPLEGIKPYGTSVSCCLSSGPRGMAMAPQLAYLTYTRDGQAGVAVEFLESSHATLSLGGSTVTIRQAGGFPLKGESAFTFQMEKPATFGFKVRSPAWGGPMVLNVGGEQVKAGADGWAEIAPRAWQNGQTVSATFHVGGQFIVGDHGNAGRAALKWGPLVLAYDQKRNADLPSPSAVALVEPASQTPVDLKPHDGNSPTFSWPVVTIKTKSSPCPAVLVPYADAGADGGRIRVWMHTPETLPPPSLLSDARESRSRRGNQHGSIIDGDRSTFAVTFDGKGADADWFAVEVDSPVTIKRVTFAHGKCYHDGGWFDASAGKPKVQVKKSKDGPWETVGELADYPATTATDNGKLKDGQAFTLVLKEPVAVVGVRVIGKPACGDGPKQAFSSCGELEVAAE